MKINLKNIFRGLEDLNEKYPQTYQILFDTNMERHRNDYTNIKNIFRYYDINMGIDSWSSCNNFLYVGGYAFASKNNKYFLNWPKEEIYGKRICLEDFIKCGKNIFDFSITELTEEELFYLKMKEII